MTPSAEPANVDSFAARSKDSGTLILPCPGAVMRTPVESMYALDIPARAPQRSALKKAFPVGRRVDSLVVSYTDGARTEFQGSQVMCWDEYIAGAELGILGTGAVGDSHIVIVLKPQHTEQLVP